MLQIALADISMSLDNVLAVAGAAEGQCWVLVVGLALSVLLMGIAAGLLAKLLERHRGIAWIGVLIVLYVALKMIWEGSHQVALRRCAQAPKRRPRRYNSPCLRKLSQRPLPTMTWSCSTIDSASAAALDLGVMAMSSRDGVGSPLG